MSAELRREVAAALSSYAPVEFIADPAAVVGTDPGLTLQNGGVLVTLGPIQLSDTDARVPISIRRTADDARGVTLLLTRRGGEWTVTNAVDGTWIS